MSECCTSNHISGYYPRSHSCPVNGKNYSSVKLRTLLHHVSAPWKQALTEQGYYFCTDPDCDVVYFGQDNSVIGVSKVRTHIWQKFSSDDAKLCHCFGITKAQAIADYGIKAFVTEQVKKSLCSCETSNPSGRCCLKDFPEH